jgi:hypothetical protein
MTVYVDDMRAPFRRMIMCHMTADTEAELHEMANKIGVARKWYQGDHYDICLAMSAKAVKFGAAEITWLELSRKIRRGDIPKPDPISPHVCFLTLLLMGDVAVTEEECASWTQEQREQAHDWAGREHLVASDNHGIKRVPRPNLLRHPTQEQALSQTVGPFTVSPQRTNTGGDDE